MTSRPTYLRSSLSGLEQVVLVVLLEDVDARRLGQRAEVNRGGVDRRGDVHEPQVERAARQLHVADVAHERQVRVVDGQGQLGLVVERRCACPERSRGVLPCTWGWAALAAGPSLSAVAWAEAEPSHRHGDGGAADDENGGGDPETRIHMIPP